MRYFSYFYMFCKRLLKKPSFLIILLLMPLFSFAVMHFSTTEQSDLNVAIYNSGNDSLSDSMEDYLLNLDGMVSFYKCSSKDEVYDRVKSRESDCGYVLPKDLSKRMEQNVKLGAIESVRSPGSTMTSFANEFVITALLDTYSFDVLNEYTLESGDFPDLDNKEITAELHKYYEQYLFSDKTFNFNYMNDSNSFVDKVELVPEFLMHSTYGINALFIFIAALAGALMAYKDKENGLFTIFSPARKAYLQYIDILAPALICSVVAIIGSCILEGFDKIFMLSFRTICYVILCCGVCAILRLIVPSAISFAAFIPILIIGSMILSPVFIDVSIFIPRLSVAKYLFLPTYYLNFNGFSTTLLILLCGILISIAGFLLSYRSEKKI